MVSSNATGASLALAPILVLWQAGPRLGVAFHDRPLRGFPRQLLERLGQVGAVMEQEHSPRALGEQKRHQWRVSLGGVALPTCEYKVVGPIVGRLASPWAHMVERDGVGRNLGAAVCAHRTMLGEKPLTVRLLAATFGAAKRSGSSGAGWIAPAI